MESFNRLADFFERFPNVGVDLTDAVAVEKGTGRMTVTTPVGHLAQGSPEDLLATEDREVREFLIQGDVARDLPEESLEP